MASQTFGSKKFDFHTIASSAVGQRHKERRRGRHVRGQREKGNRRSLDVVTEDMERTGVAEEDAGVGGDGG